MSLGKLGQYELLSPLGKGGMAEVFKARALSGPHEGHEFALKRLLPELQNDPEYVGLFAGEADMVRVLDHPNIVKVHEVGVDQGSYFLVMELIDGQDGGQIVKRCRERKIPWPIDFAVYLTKVLLDALSYAHDAKSPTGKPLGIVHCDVSPSNLFISRTGDIKLGDFGVARGVLDGGAARDLMGKPYYLSPETLNGVISPATDLWAATVTLYELLTLSRPFPGKTRDQVFAAIQAGDRVPLNERRSGVPPKVAAVIDRGFAPDEKDRFPDAGTYAKALQPLYDERVGTSLAISSVVRGLFP